MYIYTISNIHFNTYKTTQGNTCNTTKHTSFITF